MLDPEQRRLLGDFVRAHRERLAPEASTGSRRTPGMRREELAAKAGMSATWCAWIEQGREVQASPDALGRLARALALSRAERAYLFELSGRRDPELEVADPTPESPASLRAIVTALEDPAYGLDPLWNACWWNRAAEQSFLGWLDGAHQRHLLRFVFLDPTARKLIPDWEDRARRLLAEFRADYGQSFRDARVRGLADELLTKSCLFASAWNEQGVQHRAGGLREFVHPKEGPLSFEQHTFIPAERRDYKLVMLVRRPPANLAVKA